MQRETFFQPARFHWLGFMLLWMSVGAMAQTPNTPTPATAESGVDRLNQAAEDLMAKADSLNRVANRLRLDAEAQADPSTAQASREQATELESEAQGLITAAEAMQQVARELAESQQAIGEVPPPQVTIFRLEPQNEPDTTAHPAETTSQRLKKQATALRQEADANREEAKRLREQARSATLEDEKNELRELADRRSYQADALEDAAGDLLEAALDLQGNGRKNGFGLSIMIDEQEDDNPPVDFIEEGFTENERLHIGLFAMDLGINTFLQNGRAYYDEPYDDLELRLSNSIHVGLHFFPTTLNLASRNIQLMSSLMLDLPNYGFERDITLMPESDDLTWRLDSGANYRTNKLAMTYITLPILVRFSTNSEKPHRGLRFAIGGYGSLLVNSRVKQKESDGNRSKINDRYNLLPFQYGLTARFGYRFLEFYSNYALSPLFEPDITFNAHSFQIGLRLITI